MTEDGPAKRVGIADEGSLGSMKGQKANRLTATEAANLQGQVKQYAQPTANVTVPNGTILGVRVATSVEIIGMGRRRECDV